MDVLESLGTEAFPAINAMTQALHDPDIFVRWAAARTLGELVKMDAAKTKFSAEQAQAAVAGTTALLSDQDLGVHWPPPPPWSALGRKPARRRRR